MWRLRFCPWPKATRRLWWRPAPAAFIFRSTWSGRSAGPGSGASNTRGCVISLPAPGVEKAIRKARIIVICPSNPFISVGPILEVPGIRQAVSSSRALVAAVSPIVGGRALKGPAAKMLKEMGHPVSAEGVARIYRGLLDVFVLDEQDADSAPAIERLGMRVVVRNTVMDTSRAKRALARAVLRLV